MNNDKPPALKSQFTLWGLELTYSADNAPEHAAWFDPDFGHRFVYVPAGSPDALELGLDSIYLYVTAPPEDPDINKFWFYTKDPSEAWVRANWKFLNSRSTGGATEGNAPDWSVAFDPTFRPYFRPFNGSTGHPGNGFTERNGFLARYGFRPENGFAPKNGHTPLT